MAITYVGGKQTFYTGTGGAVSVSLTDLTGGLASAPAQDDFVSVWVGFVDGTNRDIVVSGYDERSDLYENDAADANGGMFTKAMTASPDTSISVSVGASTATINVFVQVHRGVNLTTPMDVSPVSDGNVNSGSAIIPAINPATSGAWVVGGCCGCAGNILDVNPPLGNPGSYNPFMYRDSGQAIPGMGSKVWSGSGAVGPFNMGSVSGGNSSWVATHMALRPITTTNAAGTASGVGAAVATSVVTKAAAGSAAGRTIEAEARGSKVNHGQGKTKTVQISGASPGGGVALGVGAATVGSPGAAAGAGGANAPPRTFTTTVGAAAGTSIGAAGSTVTALGIGEVPTFVSVLGVGHAIQSGEGAGVGISVAVAVSTRTAASVGASIASSSVSSVAAFTDGTILAAGAASGISVATAGGATTAGGVGGASGAGGAASESIYTQGSAGLSVGTVFVEARTDVLQAGEGSAESLGQAFGISSGISASVGGSFGAGAAFAFNDGSVLISGVAGGTSTGTATGASTSAPEGEARGTGTATGAAVYYIGAAGSASGQGFATSTSQQQAQVGDAPLTRTAWVLSQDRKVEVALVTSRISYVTDPQEFFDVAA